MLYPDINELLKLAGNRYALVTATAKRARQIAEESEKLGMPLTIKPVKAAINEIVEGKIKIYHA